MTTIATIGHSTRTIDEFVALVHRHRIKEILDVRRYPVSRRYPWFGRASLEERLRAEGVRYRHDECLGGHRDARPSSPHTGLRDDQLRGYADYMETDEFARALDRLIVVGGLRRLAIMCAEADPARCHRSMIADALDVRGVAVEHIRGATDVVPHRRTAGARLQGRTLIYAASQDELPLS